MILLEKVGLCLMLFDTTSSCVVCDKIGRLCNTLKNLSLPSTEFYIQPTGIANIVSLSLLSNTNQKAKQDAQCR